MSTIIKWFSAVLGLIAIFILVAFVRVPHQPRGLGAAQKSRVHRRFCT